ncbi:hypothetical protein EJ02DRAFT_360247, partial [Clathrospora elynae]
RSTSSNNRGRTRRPARSRTPSPSKPTPQTYRTRNLHHANVFVETLPNLPCAIDNAMREILGINSWDEQPAVLEQRLDTVAAWYQAESQRNTQNVSIEGDWKFSLFGLVRQLSDPSASDLKAHISEKVWNPDLKPKSSLLDNNRDEDSGGTHTPRLSQTALPCFSPADAAYAVAGFARPVPYLPPDSDSAAPTTSTEAADPYHISTPKPDITVGIAHTGFIPQHQRRLVDHQASGSILSDPHTPDMDIRFPFLIVETKGLSANGTLVNAQNQAAVSGASMLAILQDLNNQADWNIRPAIESESTTLQKSPRLCFSVVTAGPTNEVCVHFIYLGAFHMHCIRSCRTTHRRDTREFVHLLDRIFEWGRGVYKSSIVRRLDQVPRCE